MGKTNWCPDFGFNKEKRDWEKKNFLQRVDLYAEGIQEKGMLEFSKIQIEKRKKLQVLLHNRLKQIFDLSLNVKLVT